MVNVEFKDFGLISFEKCWRIQEELHQTTIAQKLNNRKFNLKEKTKNYLIFCEHPHVYTLGKSGNDKHLLADKSMLEKIGAEYFEINRGGDITYHGPGQIVGYPIFDLDYFFTDIHKYLRYLEEAVIQTLQEFGISGGRFPSFTGVWLDPEDPVKARKICAIGVRASRWVTMHGFAFNVNTNLDYFNHIVPCGISNKKVTSLQKELGSKQDIEAVKNVLMDKLSRLFEFQAIPV